MILYLDTSALVKAYVEEIGSRQVLQAMRKARASASHRIACVEARAAFARLYREHVLELSQWEGVKREFMSDWRNYMQFDTTPALIDCAGDLAEASSLRAYDSVHLAAAHLLVGHSAEPVVFACFDRKLNRVAEQSGLQLLDV